MQERAAIRTLAASRVTTIGRASRGSASVRLPACHESAARIARFAENRRPRPRKKSQAVRSGSHRVEVEVPHRIDQLLCTGRLTIRAERAERVDDREEREQPCSNPQPGPGLQIPTPTFRPFFNQDDLLPLTSE